MLIYPYCYININKICVKICSINKALLSFYTNMCVL